MGTSLLRATGRLFAPVVAVALLAGVSLEAGAGGQGAIHLQLGPAGSPSQFVYFTPDGKASDEKDIFSGGKGNQKCFFFWKDPDQKLVGLKALRGGSSAGQSIGIGPDSLGVYDNSSGVSCYRMQGDISEGLEFSLDNDLAAAIGRATGKTPAIGSLYFDMLDLDMEVKQDAVFTLTVLDGQGSGHVYELRSGSAIVDGEGSDGPSSWPDRTIFNCNSISDSGSDAGANDNCRWVIEDIGKSFVLEAIAGEGSWEGGGDYGPAARANDSIISLVTLVETGTLYCSPNSDPEKDNKTGIVGGGPVASCQTTRINPNNLGQFICRDFPDDAITYDLETFVGEGSKCELRKKSDKVQFAGSIELKFEPELMTPTDDVWGAKQTLIRFSCRESDSGVGKPCEPVPGKIDQYQTKTPYPAPRCKGTVVNDANGNLTILEVLAEPEGSEPDFVEDQVPGNGLIDWACVLDHQEIFRGNNLLQVVQTILYWGDISFSRGGSN